MQPAHLDADWNTQAQYGATLLAAIDHLTHYPSKPADMDDEFYQIGAGATQTSNLSYRWGFGNINHLVSALDGCMSDSGSASNLSCLGHRRWLLSPLADMRVGFGEADSASGATFVDTKVFESGSFYYEPKSSYQFIAWPAAGEFPNELLSTGDAWSLTLNPDIYAAPQTAEVSVTVTRAADGQSWTLDQSDYTASPVNTQPYFNVNNGGYSISNCIIFLPGRDNWGVSAFNGKYTVRVSGLKYIDGSPATLEYGVNFFDTDSVFLSDGVFNYVLLEDGLTVTGLVDPASFGSLSVPAQVNGYPVTAIGESAFAYCLCSAITLPDTITAIGDKAFYAGSFAGEFAIPPHVKRIGTYAFSYMRSVTAFTMDETVPNADYSCVGGALYSLSGGVPVTLLSYPLASEAREFAPPASVTKLYCTSLAGAKNLDAVYSLNPALSAMTYTFYSDTLDLYLHPDAPLAYNADALYGALTVRDATALPLFAYDSGAQRIRVVNHSGGELAAALVMAAYRQGQMRRCGLFALDAGENEVFWIDAEGDYSGDALRFFCLDPTSFAPLRAALKQ